MKFKHLLFSAMLAVPALALAVPAAPGLRTVTNPDGTIVEIQVFGDEHFHYTTDASGHYLMEKDSRGFWTTMSRNGHILTTNAEDLKLLYDAQTANLYSPSTQPESRMSRMAALNTEGRTTYQTVGSPHALVILVEFSDVKFSIPEPQQTITKMLTEPGYSLYGSNGSVLDYFTTVSGGMFTPQFDVSRVVTLQYNQAYYGQKSGSSGAHTKIGELIYEAVTALDDEIDFAQYDVDGDDIIDNIYFLYAGNGAADTGDTNLIWPHNNSYYTYINYYQCPTLSPDGKLVRSYAIGNELKSPRSLPPGASAPWLDGIGTFTHEYGHVLGLPDLYDAYYQSFGGAKTPSPDKYDIMDQGSYNDFSRTPPGYSAYEKWLCNWLEYEDIIPTDSGEYTVPSHSDGKNQKAYRLRLPALNWKENRPYYATEYFIVEARSNDHWDSTMPEHGIFIWDVNYDRKFWTSNQVNCNGTQRLRMMPATKSAQGQKFDKNAWGVSTDGTITYPGSENAIIPQSGTILKDFGIFLTGISYDAEAKEGKFQYNMVDKDPDIRVVLHSPAVVKGATRELFLTWSVSEDSPVQPDGYYVTVTREDNNGTVRYCDGLNSKDVGNVNNIIVRNFSNNAIWSQKVTASVLAYKDGIPASTTSNVLEFYPSELTVEYDPEDKDGVDSVESDTVSIFGGHGFIQAPADARIYTISGQPIGRENLPAGIYIVNYNGKSAKVVVR